ncbi:MAG TPA: ATP-binding protein [Actinomycetota bacterium]|nr:ATP-binding protein [Actinomycetota bacterium]
MGDLNPDGVAGGTSEELRRTARIAGLRDFESPTLEQVERRRVELIFVSFSLVVLFAAGLAILTAFVEPPDTLGNLGRTADALRVLIVLLGVLFGAYVWEKERHLRRLSRILVNERVLAAALSNRLKEISSLSEAGKAVVSMLELEDVLKVVLYAASDLLEADEGSVQLVEGDDLVVAAAVGPTQRFLGQRTSMMEGLAGYVARSREPLLIEGRPDMSDFGVVVHAREKRIESAISVPLEAKSELLGVLNLNVTTGERRYNEYDLRALRLFGEHAAMAIRHGRALRRERELRTQILELDRLRSELVGSMTHDLKTPLTTILGNAKLLLKRGDELAVERRDESLEAIVKQSERLLVLIERLLDAARSQARATLAPTMMDIVPVVERIAAAYTNAHGLRVVIERSSETLPVFADPDAVEQVLANLLENAVKHAPQGTTVCVRMRSAGDTVQLVVADDGPGIAPEVRDRLFEPYRQGEGGSGGVGLGLFIVSSLVTAMGGTIDVRSDAGGGATFTITLRAEAGEPAAPEAK